MKKYQNIPTFAYQEEQFHANREGEPTFAPSLYPENKSWSAQ